MAIGEVGPGGAEWPWTLEGQQTILDVLRRAVDQRGDLPFVDVEGDVASCVHLDERSNALARGLMGLGVERGHTVCTMLDTSVDALVAMLAIVKLGAISVPVNTNYKGEFLRHQIGDAGSAVVIAEAHYADLVLGVSAGTPEVRVLVVRGGPLPTSPSLDIRSLDAVRAAENGPLGIAVAPGDTAMLVYTSGTTGPSKGCMISHNYACNQAIQITRANGVGKDDVYWTPLPLYHINAISCGFIGALVVGARIALNPHFSVSGFWPEIERTQATVIGLIGSMIALVGAAPDNEASLRYRGGVRTVMGAPFPETLRKAWMDRFGVQRCGPPGYGMTEASLSIWHRVGDPHPANASGKRFDDFDVRMLDDEGGECPPGQPGEIVLRPRRPNIMFQGYWRRPEATAEATRDLWFHTGDIGMFDEQGFFYFLDRKKDYLRRGGENISSHELEATFNAHPDLADVAVHAVFSEHSEDEVKVTAVLRDGAVLSEEALCRWSIERLPRFAVPRFIEFRDSLPRNPTGKVLKYELRKEGVTPATWDRQAAGIVIERKIPGGRQGR